MEKFWEEKKAETEERIKAETVVAEGNSTESAVVTEATTTTAEAPAKPEADALAKYRSENGKILEKARQMDSGKFSSYRPGSAADGELSHADRISMYEKAYALRRTNPTESQAEIARLDRMFAK
jgi:hypothetical protein